MIMLCLSGTAMWHLWSRQLYSSSNNGSRKCRRQRRWGAQLWQKYGVDRGDMDGQEWKGSEAVRNVVVLSGTAVIRWLGRWFVGEASWEECSLLVLHAGVHEQVSYIVASAANQMSCKIVQHYKTTVMVTHHMQRHHCNVQFIIDTYWQSITKPYILYRVYGDCSFGHFFFVFGKGNHYKLSWIKSYLYVWWLKIFLWFPAYQ